MQVGDNKLMDDVVRNGTTPQYPMPRIETPLRHYYFATDSFPFIHFLGG